MVKVPGPQQPTVVPMSPFLAAGRPFTKTWLLPLIMGPIVLCAQAGQPCESDEQLAFIPTQAYEAGETAFTVKVLVVSLPLTETDRVMVLGPVELKEGRVMLPTLGEKEPDPLHLTWSEMSLPSELALAPKTQPVVKTLGLRPAG